MSHLHVEALVSACFDCFNKLVKVLLNVANRAFCGGRSLFLFGPYAHCFLPSHCIHLLCCKYHGRSSFLK